MDINFNTIISYLTSVQIQEALLPVKIVFLTLAGLLLATIIFTLSKTHYLEWLFILDAVQFVTMRPFGAKKITRQWNRVLRRFETALEAEYKLAVIEADDILDACLKRMGYVGQTLEERLGKLTSATLPNIEQLYEAHRLRNNVVHDPDYQLTLSEARKIVDAYEKAFRDLQILEK